MRHRVNEGCKVLGAIKGVMKNRGLGMDVKKVLYEKVIVPTVMYGSELWGMKVSERRKLNVFEMKCLRSMAACVCVRGGLVEYLYVSASLAICMECNDLRLLKYNA